MSAERDRGADPADEGPVQLDTSVAHMARVYDYWLGGKDNFAADRAAAEQAIAANPGILRDVRANRAFLARAVRYLAAERGIRQFLDIGTGIPTANNTHEVAQSVAPECRVVYVDNDPVVLTHARALLTSAPEGATAYIDADLRDTRRILERAAQTLDFSRPVAVTLLAILHLIPDEDDPRGIVATLMAATASGSYLALSHPAGDIRPAAVAEMSRRINARLGSTRGTMRNHAQIARFFDGLTLVEPGVVQPQWWRPATPSSDAEVAVWCGVARKA
ncbi:MAG TPA: SAM-dependent methyltransferase [Streptosporangiaceae bacterium]|nr:SAM-dependent methyltransferase [Streptosporangiaceae bacterium]